MQHRPPPIIIFREEYLEQTVERRYSRTAHRLFKHHELLPECSIPKCQVMLDFKEAHMVLSSVSNKPNMLDML